MLRLLHLLRFLRSLVPERVQQSWYCMKCQLCVYRKLSSHPLKAQLVLKISSARTCQSVNHRWTSLDTSWSSRSNPAPLYKWAGHRRSVQERRRELAHLWSRLKILVFLSQVAAEG